MGQKTHPKGFRLIVNKKWLSTWIGTNKNFGNTLLEDLRVREFLKKKPICQGTADILIKRMGDRLEITIVTARPGLVIGKKGSEIETLKKQLKDFTGRDVWVEVEEIKRPDLCAQLVADNIARQLERRASYRKVMKKSIQSAMDSGALGVKIQCSGRLGGAEIARSEWYKEGKVPMQTLRFKIDYATARAETTYGAIGVKVWITIGETEEAK